MIKSDVAINSDSNNGKAVACVAAGTLFCGGMYFLYKLVNRGNSVRTIFTPTGGVTLQTQPAARTEITKTTITDNSLVSSTLTQGGSVKIDMVEVNQGSKLVVSDEVTNSEPRGPRAF